MQKKVIQASEPLLSWDKVESPIVLILILVAPSTSLICDLSPSQAVACFVQPRVKSSETFSWRTWCHRVMRQNRFLWCLVSWYTSVSLQYQEFSDSRSVCVCSFVSHTDIVVVRQKLEWDIRHKNIKKGDKDGGGEGLCLRGESENVIVGMRVHVSAK